MQAFHAAWAWVAVLATGLAGSWGVILAVLRRPIDRWFALARTVAFVAVGIQVAVGLVQWGRGVRPDNEFHVFYGIVIVATASFTYVYRSQLDQRPALGYGLVLLFIMGLGLRAWGNVA